MNEIEVLKNILRKPPYTDIQYWHETALALGDDFLEGYSARQLQSFKNELDEVISGKSKSLKKVRWDDDPVWIGLDKMKVERRKDDD